MRSSRDLAGPTDGYAVVPTACVTYDCFHSVVGNSGAKTPIRATARLRQPLRLRIVNSGARVFLPNGPCRLLDQPHEVLHHR